MCVFTNRFDEAVPNDSLIIEAIKFLNKHEAKLKIAYKTQNSDDVLKGKFLKNILNATTKGKVEIWDSSKVAAINNSYFYFNDNYNFVEGPQNPKANFGNIGQELTNLFIRIIIESERVLS